jgi:hypothetical protein
MRLIECTRISWIGLSVDFNFRVGYSPSAQRIKPSVELKAKWLECYQQRIIILERTNPLSPGTQPKFEIAVTAVNKNPFTLMPGCQGAIVLA